MHDCVLDPEGHHRADVGQRFHNYLSWVLVGFVGLLHEAVSEFGPDCPWKHDQRHAAEGDESDTPLVDDSDHDSSGKGGKALNDDIDVGSSHAVDGLAVSSKSSRQDSAIVVSSVEPVDWHPQDFSIGLRPNIVCDFISYKVGEQVPDESD